MNKIMISDITLREEGKNGGHTLSFKEKIETVKLLDKIGVDVIETAPINNGKTDILFLHTISSLVKNSIISCPVSLDEENVNITYDAIKNAQRARLHIMIPVSTVQMEYISHKKPKAMLETAESIVKNAKKLNNDVEVSLMDATRAEPDFLKSALETVISAGATTVTICDSAGEKLPTEFEQFIKQIKELVPENVTLSVECSDALCMASACAISCIKAGVGQIKTTVSKGGCARLKHIARIFREKADALDISTSLNMSLVENSIKKIALMTSEGTSVSPFDGGTNSDFSEKVVLSSEDDIKTVSTAILKLGYELSDEDVSKVYEEISKLPKSKKISSKELDAIIASSAMQVVPTYKLKSYVINNGNIITPTAHIVLEKQGKDMQGICVGDGPIDAAFLAIEQITGHHFELDDFQIQAVTEGREAMGSSIVKLRHNGKPYSGKGISTDIIGASISAYVNALNKICFEEE